VGFVITVYADRLQKIDPNKKMNKQLTVNIFLLVVLNLYNTNIKPTKLMTSNRMYGSKNKK
jgi:hypothetical protein